MHLCTCQTSVPEHLPGSEPARQCSAVQLCASGLVKVPQRGRHVGQAQRRKQLRLVPARRNEATPGLDALRISRRRPFWPWPSSSALFPVYFCHTAEAALAHDLCRRPPRGARARGVAAAVWRLPPSSVPPCMLRGIALPCMQQHATGHACRAHTQARHAGGGLKSVARKARMACSQRPPHFPLWLT